MFSVMKNESWKINLSGLLSLIIIAILIVYASVQSNFESLVSLLLALALVLIVLRYMNQDLKFKILNGSSFQVSLARDLKAIVSFRPGAWTVDIYTSIDKYTQCVESMDFVSTIELEQPNITKIMSHSPNRYVLEWDLLTGNVKRYLSEFKTVWSNL